MNHSLTKPAFFQITLLTLVLLPTSPLVAADNHNTLTTQEEEAGWKLLFDGEKIEGWRSYKQDSFPKQGWIVENGTLHKQADFRPGDIMTTDKYKNFEFAWDWKLSPGGNNGVKYFIIPERKATVGHEYQMIDDSSDTVQDAYTSNAAFYLVVKPSEDKPNKPLGEWNNSRIVVKDKHVEHWLNGVKVLEYECGSPEIMNRMPETKFNKYPGFGKKVEGHILLTDHKDPCWFRNLKIRELD
ncbi:MAG: DUF1080 domain-containing protein [Verrucomicrobiota bacterium]